MDEKKEISREYRGNYIVVTHLMNGDEFGCDDFEMISAMTQDGDYIGDEDTAKMLCDQRGILPRPMRDKDVGTGAICSIGFCDKEQKWYGWSHRAIYGFGIGDEVKEGDCAASSGWTDDYLAANPDADWSLPVGFKAQSLADAKRIAQAFAESVS